MHRRTDAQTHSTHKHRAAKHSTEAHHTKAQNSKVRIVLRGRPDKPLVSHRLALAYQLHWKSEEDGPQTPLVSDRNGDVVIEARKGHPTFWIRVYSGASLLARVPYAPGLIPFDTIELPDDSIRLAVEGEIQLLADELIDAIAARGGESDEAARRMSKSRRRSQSWVCSKSISSATSADSYFGSSSRMRSNATRASSGLLSSLARR